MNETSENEVTMLKLVAAHAQIDRIGLDLKRDHEESVRRGMELVTRGQQIDNKESSEWIEIEEELGEAFTRQEWQIYFLQKAAALEIEYGSLYVELRKSTEKKVFGASRRKKLIAIATHADGQVDAFIGEIQRIFKGEFVDLADYPGFKVFLVDSFSMNKSPEIHEETMKLASNRLAGRSLARGDHKLKGWKEMSGN